MRSHLTRQSRADLERLLDGQPAHQDALAQLLAAAGTSGARSDTAGLDAALTAFRSVSHPVSADHPRRSSMLKNAAAKMMAAKLLTVSGVALAATGGIAAAASTGHLPNPLPHSEHASDVAVAAVASHAKPSASPTESETASATESETESSSSPSAKPSAIPSPSLRGLCQSWLSRPHEHGKADSNPAFTVLVTTAGGTDSVNGYCTTLLTSSQASESSEPTESSEPAESDHSSEPKETHSARPTHSHPSEEPSEDPSTEPSHSRSSEPGSDDSATTQPTEH